VTSLEQRTAQDDVAEVAAIAVKAGDLIGEGPAWDGSAQRLIWVDQERGLVHEARADGDGWSETRRWHLERRLAAVVPRANGGLVVAGGNEILALDEAGAVASLARLDIDTARARINDAKCDPQGRLWAATLTADFARGDSALYRIDPDGHVERILGGITIGNGLEWSLDGGFLYFVDSLTLSIDRFDFDGDEGTIGNRCRLVTFAAGEGAPNGLTVDDDGNLWVAATGAGEVRCFTPEGRSIRRIRIETPGATSCAFGGAEGGDLFITSLGRRMPDVARTIGLSEAMMTNEGPCAGDLYVCRPGGSGPAATPFAG
jgi:sugar lactone lactonase YvrE